MQREELACQIGPAPFARAGIHVEGEEGVPRGFGEVGAGEPHDLDAVRERVAPLAPDDLALARCERARGNPRSVAKPRILPVELLVGAQEEAALAERAPFRLAS